MPSKYFNQISAEDYLDDLIGDEEEEAFDEEEEEWEAGIDPSVVVRPPLALNLGLLCEDRLLARAKPQVHNVGRCNTNNRGKQKDVRRQRKVDRSPPSSARDRLLAKMPLAPPCERTAQKRSQSYLDLALACDEMPSWNKRTRDDITVCYRRNGKVTSVGSLSLKGLYRLLPVSIVPSALGPVPLATHVVVCTASQRIALILFSSQRALALPMLGCSDAAISKLQEDVDKLVSDEDNNGGMMGTFWRICEQLDGRKREWIRTLDQGTETKQAAERNGAHIGLLRQAFSRAGVHVERPVSQFQVFQQLVDRVCNLSASKATTIPVGSAADEATSNMDSNMCLICFDEMPSQGSHLVNCGHSVCFDCWSGYLRSAARSGGTANLVCPAEDCKASLDIFDAAHILFAGEVQEDDQYIFKKLVSNELEELNRLSNARYCPSPDCGRVFTPSMKRNDLPEGCGWNLLLCDGCGVSICAECNVGQAHPGMTCSSFKRMRDTISSGKGDAQFMNYQWMLTNTRPCPRCQCAIHKDGGCNHVSCSKCQYYFCWQCGGLGNNCFAFRCKNTSGYWLNQAEFGSFDKMRCRLQMYQDYLRADNSMNALWKTIRTSDAPKVGTGGSSDTALFAKLQLQQAILWIRGYLAAKESPPLYLCKPLRSLEIIMRAMTVRWTMQEIQEKGLVGAFKQPIDIFAAALDSLEKPKKISEGDNHGQGSRDEEFLGLVADLELEEQCLMGERAFQTRTQRAMKDGLQFLLHENEPPSLKRRNKNCSKSAKPVLAPLNQREKKSQPWKLGFEKEEMEDKNEETVGSRARWKGKTKSMARRLEQQKE